MISAFFIERIPSAIRVDDSSQVSGNFHAEKYPDAISIVGFVRQHDCSRSIVVEQMVGGLSVMFLPAAIDARHPPWLVG
ncbi:hypothetical protein SAMN03159288_05076 [Rhizobium sp. NFACC06-2]|nr:hypothetical protein SAMN03159288_05076 [Rhizobium sp. NFACC06-2]